MVDRYLCYIQGIMYMKTINCREAGFECDYVVNGQSEEEVMKNGADHAIREHGMKPEDITPQFKEKVRSLIHDS
jgi:predicted small metal-binding protein